MSEKIDVSFVMTVYNKEYYLPSVLKALLNQSGLKNPEFVFVDDLSKDKSVDIIREYTKDIPNVKIIANQDNRGISVRINQGIEAAEGEYIRMLDSDDIFPLDSTEKMLELARKHKADMVYGCF
ncbi:MAG: glycosyltransferase family 2 protein, partial [Alphaproteobacteria bacterium]